MAYDLERNVKMSPEVAGAVLAVSKSLGAIVKMKDNSFERYSFASIDDFIAHVRDHCFDNDLSIIQNEAREPELIETKKKDGSPLMMWVARYGFYLVHKSGESYGPIFRTVMVQANGAQAAGSSQSYAMKQFIRSIFMVPTSDKDDPDMKMIAEISHAHNARTDLQKKATNLKNSMKKKKTLQELNEFWDENGVILEDIKKVSSGAYKHLEDCHTSLCKKVETGEE
jgi:hypothetical protein